MEENSNEEIKNLIKNELQDSMWQTLTYLEVAFPHRKGDGSENELRFSAIRQKVLRTSNDSIRNLDSIFNNYVTLKLYEYKKEINKNLQQDIISFKDKYQVIKRQEVKQ